MCVSISRPTFVLVNQNNRADLLGIKANLENRKYEVIVVDEECRLLLLLPEHS